MTEDDDDDINEMQIVILLNQPCSSNPNKTQLNWGKGIFLIDSRKFNHHHNYHRYALWNSSGADPDPPGPTAQEPFEEECEDLIDGGGGWWQS